jgi:hypothetical protein
MGMENPVQSEGPAIIDSRAWAGEGQAFVGARLAREAFYLTHRITPIAGKPGSYTVVRCR